MKPKLLVIDDDAEICTQMKWALAQDYDVFLARDRQSALAVFRAERPTVVTLDLGLPPLSQAVEEGFHTLNEILQEDADAKVIIVTGQNEKEHALQAIGQGAYDFFCKPIQIEELTMILRRALHIYQLEQEHRALQRSLHIDSFEGILGTSPQMQKVFAVIRKVATPEVSVLIAGESGTGKELVARAIHQQSPRKDGPFIAINCSAIPENLLESELFGHEKGAFTGAHTQRKGRIESAQDGTLFLDEIGELSLSLQAKLLRFLQEHTIERVGGREEIVVNARVIAATNTDLKKAMAAGDFREDLYYRLNVVVIVLPPLRERTGDITLLAKAFLQRYAVENHKKCTSFTPQALAALKAHHWPGNVRELENRIKRAVIMAEGLEITPTDLDLSASAEQAKTAQTLREAREALEKELVQQALARNKGNITRAAADLGISRPTLHDLLTKYDIER